MKNKILKVLKDHIIQSLAIERNVILETDFNKIADVIVAEIGKIKLNKEVFFVYRKDWTGDRLMNIFRTKKEAHKYVLRLGKKDKVRCKAITFNRYKKEPWEAKAYVRSYYYSSRNIVTFDELISYGL